MSEPTVKELRSFAVFLGAFRRDRRRTLRSLADEADIDFTYLSKIEHGHDRPSLALVGRLDAALHADGGLVKVFSREPCPRCGRSNTEARAQPDEPSAVVVLHDALYDEIARHTRCDGQCSGLASPGPCAACVNETAATHPVLADTSPAATEARQQIEREAVAVWRKGVHAALSDLTIWRSRKRAEKTLRALLASAEGEK